LQKSLSVNSAVWLANWVRYQKAVTFSVWYCFLVSLYCDMFLSGRYSGSWAEGGRGGMCCWSVTAVHFFPLQVVIAHGDKLAQAENDRLAFLLLSVSILKKLLHCSQDVRKLWLGGNAEHNLLSVLFRLLGHCKYSLRTECFLFASPNVVWDLVCQGSKYEDYHLPGCDAIQSDI
jgi:hypothetical protein